MNESVIQAIFNALFNRGGSGGSSAITDRFGGGTGGLFGAGAGGSTVTDIYNRLFGYGGPGNLGNPTQGGGVAAAQNNVGMFGGPGNPIQGGTLGNPVGGTSFTGPGANPQTTGIMPPFLGVGVYRGRGPGGEGSDYYGWPDNAANSQTQFPPPPFQKGGQPYKML